MKNVLFVHQSADLYGSDKTLLFLVEALKKNISPIVVVPEEGPLIEELRKKEIRVIISPVLKVSRQLFTSFKIFIFPFLIYLAIKKLKKELGNTKIDIIHSNTLAVFLGAFYSRKYKIKHIWHVHEIIKYPKLVAKSYPFLVNTFSDYVIFNSKASYEHLCYNYPKLKKKSKVIYNGLSRKLPISPKSENQKTRNKLFKSITSTTIILGLVGRINKFKGHHLLLDTFEEIISKGYDNVKLLFVGSTISSQEYLLDELIASIHKKGLENKVTIKPFQKKIWKYYDSIDVVIVPTTDPESFGLVALEGMLSKKPVIGSNHGGLKEIIVHNETGLLFKPNDNKELMDSIIKLISNKEMCNKFGEQGEKRAKLYFSLENYISNFRTLYNSI